MLALALLLSLPDAALAQAADDKAAEDPTKISTVVGVGYAADFTVSGSVALGPLAQVNVRLMQGGQWALGASYLFPVCILTFTAGRNQFDNGSVQTRYALGGFVPASQMGLETGKWQLFVPFGYSYSQGEMAVANVELDDPVLVQVSSNSGYVGLFGIRPMTERTTLLLAAMGSKGTGGYSGFNVGGGVSFHLTDRDRVMLFAHYMDNSYGQEQKLGVSYRHEF